MSVYGAESRKMDKAAAAPRSFINQLSVGGQVGLQGGRGAAEVCISGHSPL